MRLQRLQVGAWMSLLLGLAVASAARADVYTHQIEMTAVLLEAEPSSFEEACARLLGKLVKDEGIAKCERGPGFLAISFTDEVVHWAMIAYPSTPENIQGLWQKAREVFGKPDSEKAKELTWRLKRGVTAAAGYDHEYSTFVLVRRTRN